MRVATARALAMVFAALAASALADPAPPPTAAATPAAPAALAEPAPAESTADAWLVRMARALDTLEYQGVFVYVHDGQVEAMQVSRTIGQQGVREHLVSLTGDRRQVVRDGDVVRWLLPSGMVTLNDPQPSPLWRLDAQQLAAARSHYRYTVAGRGRVAGYEAAVIDASPRDALRYGYRLWIERGTGMLLGSALVAHDGGAVEQLMFTSLQLRTARTRAPAPSVVPPAERPALEADWRAPGLPAGFELAALPAAPANARHFLYTDGLANVSIYIEPANSTSEAWSGAARRGAINVFGRLLNGHRVVVMGDLPAATVERIAQSVEPAAGR